MFLVESLSRCRRALSSFEIGLFQTLSVHEAWRPFWMFCCCKNDVDQDKHSRALRVSELGIRSGPDDALGKALVHLAFWKLGPDEFSAEWIKKQEAEWHRKVELLGRISY